MLPDRQVRAATAADEDRRSERRYRGQGPLKLSFDDPAPREIVGRLLDYSQSGFRAAHKCAALRPGQVVVFQHAFAGGKARVMWNRIANARVETGFFVIELSRPSQTAATAQASSTNDATKRARRRRR